MDRKKLTLLLIVIAASVVLYLSFSEKKPARSDNEDYYAPLLQLRDEGTGLNFASGDLMGKVLFVNFWASWCPPCKEEMPSIEALFREMKENNDFQMITILYKDSYIDGTGFVKGNGFTIPVYADQGGVAARTFGVTGVPETYLLDKKGQIRKKVLGPAEWNSQQAKDLINSLLNE
jgi:cytochrome c biogenesis protein CcmG, thiol:disulfide interchange protein DsbE